MNPERVQGVKQMLMEMKKIVYYEKRLKQDIYNSINWLYRHLPRSERDLEFHKDFDAAIVAGFVHYSVVGKNSVWGITSAGHDFLNSVSNELEETKAFLQDVKDGRKRIVNDSILNKAYVLGLVKVVGNYWELTEFGEEFLVEANNDT